MDYYRFTHWCRKYSCLFLPRFHFLYSGGGWSWILVADPESIHSVSGLACVRWFSLKEILFCYPNRANSTKCGKEMWKNLQSVKKPKYTVSGIGVTSRSFVCYGICQSISVSGCDPLAPGSWVACRKELFGIIKIICLFGVLWVFFPFCISQLYWSLFYAQEFEFFLRTPESVMYRSSSVSIESDRNWRSLQASNYTMGLYPVFPFFLFQSQWRNHLKWLQVWCCRQYNVSRSFWKPKGKHDSFWACSKTEKQTLLHLLNLLLFGDMNTVNSACFTQGSICIAIWPLITQL